MSKSIVLLDTGFWISLLDPTDERKKTADAEEIAEIIEDEILIVPYPTLYEFVSSRLSRREAVIEFEKLLYRPNIECLPDTGYKEKALENFFIKTKQSSSDLSLVDEVIKLILNDKQRKFDFVVTFDSGLRIEAQSLGIRVLPEDEVYRKRNY